MSDVTLDITPPPTLAAFHESDAFVRAIVGPVGSGKSSASVIEILRRAGEQRAGPDGVRRSRWAVVRNTRPQLKDTTRKTFEQWVPDHIGTWNESDFSYRLRWGAVDAEVLFRALDRPRDVRKVLSLELTGAWINEGREVPREVFDGLQARVGRYPAVADGGASWRGLWTDTNPWSTDHWGYRLFSKDRPAGFELFEQPGAREPDAENVENLDPGYYDRLTLGKDAEWVAEYVDAKYPTHDKGSIFGELLTKLEARGGISDFWHPSDGCHVSLDLGVSDATALWWWRFGEDRHVDVIDWYEATGKGADHFFEMIDKRGWQIRTVYLPHDARARTFQTGVSTLEQFITHFRAGRVAITPELSLDDGIRAARWLLEAKQGTRFHARCAEGVERLRQYRYTWDEDKKVYSRKPLHDWTSHTADALRYVACVVQPEEKRTRPKADVAAPIVRPYTLNDVKRLVRPPPRRM